MREKIIYGNWRVYHPDGTLMFLCEDKKANWYLKKDLATKISDNEILLTFQPSGKGRQSLYDLSEKKNICVVCGLDNLELLTKHHVIPTEYRKFFPLHKKSRLSHDILIMCQNHHWEYENKFAQKLKLKLESENNIQRNNINKNKKRSYQVQRYADLLLDYDVCQKLPKYRINFFLSEMKSVFGTDDPFEVQKIEIMKEIDKDNDIIGKIIVDNLTDIDEFERMWRNHFVKSMNPKFLPTGWSTEGLK